MEILVVQCHTRLSNTVAQITRSARNHQILTKMILFINLQKWFWLTSFPVLQILIKNSCYTSLYSLFGCTFYYYA